MTGPSAGGGVGGSSQNAAAAERHAVRQAAARGMARGARVQSSRVGRAGLIPAIQDSSAEIVVVHDSIHVPYFGAELMGDTFGRLGAEFDFTHLVLGRAALPERITPVSSDPWAGTRLTLIEDVMGAARDAGLKVVAGVDREGFPQTDLRGQEGVFADRLDGIVLGGGRALAVTPPPLSPEQGELPELLADLRHSVLSLESDSPFASSTGASTGFLIGGVAQSPVRRMPLEKGRFDPDALRKALGLTLRMPPGGWPKITPPGSPLSEPQTGAEGEPQQQ